MMNRRVQGFGFPAYRDRNPANKGRPLVTLL